MAQLPTGSLPSQVHVDRSARRAAGVVKWTKYDADVIPAWVAEHDLGQPPAVHERLRELVDAGAYGYHDAADPMVEAFCRWASRRHGWSPEPGLVRPTTNVVQGVWASVQAFTRPDQKIVLSDPVYYPFQDLGPTTGREVANWNLVHDGAGWHYDLNALQALLEGDPSIGLLLLCNPQNPTGRVLDADQLTRIVALAREHDVIIVSDEIHYDLVHPSAEHVPALAVPGASTCTIAVTSGIKTFAIGGLRCAVAVFGDEPLRDRFDSIPEHLLTVPNRFGCEASIAAWDTGDAWVDDLRATLDANRHRLVDRLHAELPEVGIHLPDSTFLAWLDLTAFGQGERPSTWLRAQTGVACESGPKFGAGGVGHVRLNFGTTPEVLDEIVDRLVQGLDRG
ncbi:MAG: aminotransferase class I/II-fold pyridoxal phosphate-dependent enzyme [Acidimicrobiales bacterium]|nr:aminotransferase class I/II-fold pyridoxal phosphate-dependent enzyme [Acidimicrobiales bacterium]